MTDCVKIHPFRKGFEVSPTTIPLLLLIIPSAFLFFPLLGPSVHSLLFFPVYFPSLTSSSQPLNLASSIYLSIHSLPVSLTSLSLSISPSIDWNGYCQCVLFVCITRLYVNHIDSVLQMTKVVISVTRTKSLISNSYYNDFDYKSFYWTYMYISKYYQ